MPKTIEELEAEVAQLREENNSGKLRIQELNGEAKGHRLNADNAKRDAERLAGELQAATTALEKAKNLGPETEAKAAEKIKEIEAKAAEAERLANEKAQAALSTAQTRAVNADLKIAAKEAGAHDPTEFLALLDRSKITLDENGEVKNAAELVAEFKKAKPHLFGVGSTSHAGNPPPKGPPEAKKPSEMTDEEYQKARANRAWRK